MAKVAIKDKEKTDEDLALDNLNTLKTELKQNFVERDKVIDCLLSLFLAESNVLLFGPPGTAKSALAHAVCSGMGGGSYFKSQLTKFSTPEELFGPRSVKGLKEDRFVRVTKGYMPEASVAFLDEVFKANSAVLNSLLLMLNEHEFFDDGLCKKVPLKVCIGASNELPESAELAPLYDRFLARFWIGGLNSTASRKRVMTGSASGKPSRISMSSYEIETLRRMAREEVTFPDATYDKILEIEDKMKEEGMTISDRRRRSICKALPFFALVDGSSSVGTSCLSSYITSMLWDKPDQEGKIYRLVLSVANPKAQEAQTVVDGAIALVRALPETSVKSADSINKYSAARASLADMAAKLNTIYQECGKDNAEVKESRRRLSELYRQVLQAVLSASDMDEFAAQEMVDKNKVIKSLVED